jgi:hypothetical protein
MSALIVSSIVFVCVFGAGMVGLSIRSSLPDHHLNEDSAGIVKLGAGLLATLAALVLGLLIASARVSFDADLERAGAPRALPSRSIG